MSAVLERGRVAETIRFLAEEYAVEASPVRTDIHVCAWTPYMMGPTVYLTATDAGRLPA